MKLFYPLVTLGTAPALPQDTLVQMGIRCLASNGSHVAILVNNIKNLNRYMIGRPWVLNPANTDMNHKKGVAKALSEKYSVQTQANYNDLVSQQSLPLKEENIQRQPHGEATNIRGIIHVPYNPKPLGIGPERQKRILESIIKNAISSISPQEPVLLTRFEAGNFGYDEDASFMAMFAVLRDNVDRQIYWVENTPGGYARAAYWLLSGQYKQYFLESGLNIDVREFDPQLALLMDNLNMGYPKRTRVDPTARPPPYNSQTGINQGFTPVDPAPRSENVVGPISLFTTARLALINSLSPITVAPP